MNMHKGAMEYRVCKARNCTFVNDVRLKNRKNKEKSQNTLRGGEERWSEAKPNGDDTQCL